MHIFTISASIVKYELGRTSEGHICGFPYVILRSFSLFIGSWNGFKQDMGLTGAYLMWEGMFPDYETRDDPNPIKKNTRFLVLGSRFDWILGLKK